MGVSYVWTPLGQFKGSLSVHTFYIIEQCRNSVFLHVCKHTAL